MLDSTPIVVLEAPDYAGSMTQLAIAANGTTWLVAAQADSGGGILGVRVGADGTIVDAEPVGMAPETWFQYFDVDLLVAQGEYLLVYDGQAGWEGHRFAADLRPLGTTINFPSSEARVASNGTDYFVVWDPPGGTLCGSRMSLTGTLLDPGGIPIMESFWDAGNDSHVEWDGTRWWVFHQIPYPDGGLHFVRIATDGTVIDSPPVFALDTTPASFIGTFTVAGGLAGGVELIWADQNCNCADEWATGIDPWDIRGAFISADTQMAPDEAITCAAPAQTQPYLIAGPDGFLATYVSEVDEVQRIMARRLDSLGNPGPNTAPRP